MNSSMCDGAFNNTWKIIKHIKLKDKDSRTIRIQNVRFATGCINDYHW